MKIRFFLIFYFNLIFCNLAVSKIINIDNLISLDVPENHTYTSYQRYEDFKDFFISLNIQEKKINMFSIAPTKYIDFIKEVIDGQDPMENKYIKSVIVKMEKKKFKDEVHQSKWLISEMKKIFKREKIDFITDLLIIDKGLYSILNDLDSTDDEFLQIAKSLKDMNNSELIKSTKEIRKTLTSLSRDNKSILINEDMTIILNRFKIARNQNENLFLETNGDLIYILGAMKIEVKLSFFLTEKNNKTFLVGSFCFVNCSKFNNKFDKMLKPAFTKIISTTNNNSNSSEIITDDKIRKLKKLKKLLDENVLTQEEFNKAKNKILN